VRHGELSLSGAETTDYLRWHRFDHYLMTASGLSVEIGLSEWNLEDAAVKRAALGAAAETIVAIDSSKVGSVGFVSVCSLDRPDSIVVDDDLSSSRLEELASSVRNLELVPLNAGGQVAD
jgi:DeoR/GlpR family transcriptional regulator of sugar metabolism